jgi:L-asparaginase
MMRSRLFLALLLALALGGPALAAKPRVVVLATGGTIAGAQAEGQDAGYKSGSFQVEDLIKAVPGLAQLADISGEQIVNIGSQDMSNEVWLELAKRVNQVLAQPEVTAVVVTHGTDTMEETGYFLSLVTHSAKPVVMVGSMRPATATGADGPANLYNAVAVAVDQRAGGRGVLLVINDEIHYPREATKTNTTQLDTFKSPNRGRAGMTNAGRVYWYNALATRHTTASRFNVDGLRELPRVDIFYAYANVGREYVDQCVALGCKGIVLAGVGDGNATGTMVAGLQDAIGRGVAVVRSSRTNSGITDRNVELNDDELGSIASMELNPQKARVLLMLGLTRTRDAKQLQQMFYEY